MERSVPVWLLLLCLLLGAMTAVMFGWSVKTTAAGSDRFGKLGAATLAVAGFPDLVRTTLSEMRADPDSQLRVPQTNADLSAFRSITGRPGIDVQNLMVRGDPAALARTAGWRILVGGFVINGEFQHAALALSPELEVVKAWILTEKDIPGETPKPTFGKFLHGFALLKDESVIVTYDVGVSLQRFDRCGKRLWVIGGIFDHAVSLHESGNFVWTLRKHMKPGWLGDDELVKVDVSSGRVAQTITMDAIAAANPNLEILGAREKDINWANGNPKAVRVKWLDDPFHLNDVEPLPSAIADRFPGFEADDLLVSARSLNMVFVVDPDTLKVKWWRTGDWRRQHDPDWQPTGEITVYDNQMNHNYSRIMGIIPATQTTRVVLDGQSIDFYSRIRGKHQIAPTGDLLLTVPQQGRVIEIDSNGKTVLEIFNTRPGGGKFNYPLSEAIWFPSDAFNFATEPSCAN